MKDEIRAYLFTIQTAGVAIQQFIQGLDFESYERDELVRSGVERKFEIIGEALNRISKEDPVLLERIREYREIISFRNILIHGYDSIDDQIVWDVIEEDLDNPIEDIKALLG